jgi:hypothetical protein
VLRQLAKPVSARVKPSSLVRRAAVDPPSEILRLQRAAGNRAVLTLIQRDAEGAPPKKKSPLDAPAEAIVTAAQDSSKPAADRGVALVRAIIATYFPTSTALVKDVVWRAAEPGLLTSAADGKDVQGTIYVGTSFLDQATAKGFARRVIQVDHELEHIRQHRTGGMGGPKNSNLREFLAFAREAMQAELAGTGRISHSTRVDLIDEALRNYYALSDDQRKQHAATKQALLTERERHDGKSGNAKTEPPTGP